MDEDVYSALRLDRGRWMIDSRIMVSILQPCQQVGMLKSGWLLADGVCLVSCLYNMVVGGLDLYSSILQQRTHLSESCTRAF